MSKSHHTLIPSDDDAGCRTYGLGNKRHLYQHGDTIIDGDRKRTKRVAIHIHDLLNHEPCSNNLVHLANAPGFGSGEGSDVCMADQTLQTRMSALAERDLTISSSLDHASLPQSPHYLADGPQADVVMCDQATNDMHTDYAMYMDTSDLDITGDRSRIGREGSSPFTNLRCEDITANNSSSFHRDVDMERCSGPDVQDQPTVIAGVKTGQLSVKQCDICLGVLILEAQSYAMNRSSEKTVPIELKPSGDMQVLNRKDTDQYLGMLPVPALKKLLVEFTIRMSATLSKTSSGLTQKAVRDKVAVLSDPLCSVRIVLYGCMDEKMAVCDLLSQADLYLQQPSIGECDGDLEYDNPQFMVRPGSSMPGLADHPVGTQIEFSETLQEVQKSQVMRVFDGADAANVLLTAKPSARLASRLKEHQLQALAFMIEKESGLLVDPKFPPLWELCENSSNISKYRHAVTGHREDAPRPLNGGILADEMGLGKTLCILALVCSTLDAMETRRSMNRDRLSDFPTATLVITPKSTIHNWQQQIERHIHQDQVTSMVYHGVDRHLRSQQLRDYDLIITTYETLRSEYFTDGGLLKHGWYRVVLDEAHHIRNRSSQTFEAVCALQSVHRWCLTGTPIQNSLDDFGALVSFIGIRPFLTKSAFDFWITSSIKTGTLNKWSSLQKLVNAACLRRTKAFLKDSCQLSRRIEETKIVELLHEDRALYDFFSDKTAKTAAGLAKPDILDRSTGKRSNMRIITLINILRLICNHGADLLSSAALKVWNERDISTKAFETMKMNAVTCRSYGIHMGGIDTIESMLVESEKQAEVCTACVLISRSVSPDDRPSGQTPESMRASKSHRDIDRELLTPKRQSAKIRSLLSNLAAERQNPGNLTSVRPVKSVIFSFWTKMLDLIQQAIKHQGYQYQRIDGSTSLGARSAAIARFESDAECSIMLASIGSAGEGVDLTAATFVHLIEPHWNPMVEAQAVDRVHRIGQDRDVTVIRYIVKDSIETYIQWLQQDKLRLVDRFLSPTQITQTAVEEERWKKLRVALNQNPKDP